MSGVALRARSQASQTELAPMFSVLKHLDIRVYRKVWNRIRQYWKAEKWIRVTDDEQNLKWVGLNKPITKGEQILQQAQEQGAQPQQLAQLQQQIAADPSMQEVVDTHNDISNLDVDIVMDDAPDTVTQEVEDFQAMAEMVKSGFPLPPEAVIMSSPLGNKDKILKMMKEKPQIPPELQKQMQQMQEEGKKLAEENQALKAGQKEAQAEMQLSAQESAAKLQQRQAEAQAELSLKAQKQAGELQLERERAEAEIKLQSERAEAEMALKRFIAEQEAIVERERLGMERERLALEKEKAAQAAKKETPST